jgi:hypothetical protein
LVIAREAKPTAAAEAGALVAIQLDCFVAPLLAMTSGPKFIAAFHALRASGLLAVPE